MALLDITHLTVGYSDTPILRDVSLQVAPQEMVAIVGPNGAGKSTLLKAIIGLLPPREGGIVFNGQPLTRLRPPQIVQAGVGYVPQLENVFASLTVAENLAMGAFLRPQSVRAKQDAMYSLFPDLYPKRSQRAGALSGGQRQMVAMARALMLEPRLLLLDEPTAGLAPRLVGLLFETIVAIQRTGVAILIVEQNARQALQVAQRGYVLAMGQTRYEDTGPGLLAHPDMRALFLGGT